MPGQPGRSSANRGGSHTESAADAAPQGSAQPSEAPQAPDAATGGNEAPTPVAGKEDVAGYPREKEGVTARDVIDKITGR